MSFQPLEPRSITIAIDRGGTFTDVWASAPNRDELVIKLLSIDPDNYKDAPIEGIRRVLSTYLGREISRDLPLPKDHVRSVRMGTTIATNALLERKGTRHAFLVTKGLRSLLEIGSQQRPNIFDLEIRKPDVLYDEVVEIDERVTVEGYDEDPEQGAINVGEVPEVLVRSITGTMLRILRPLNEQSTRTALERLRTKGITTLAICLAHSYLYPIHEQRIADMAKELGFRHVSLSSKVGANMIKLVARGGSASTDAYLTPKTNDYIKAFAEGFEGGDLDGLRCEFMQSDGGLVDYKAFGGLRGILSGPAGGVVGYARTSYTDRPVVGFDMGGTSTDVSRFGGTFEHVFEATISGVTIQTPQLDINTIAAGGGSILAWENGMFKVGPESAGAHPGPASYRKGGPLTVTDANLLLGRLVPEYFPSIFGPNEDQTLDVETVREQFATLTESIFADTGMRLGPEEVAHGFIQVANESMCRPIRALTEARGHEISLHDLAIFGGAGGQHACEIAENLGINRVVLHKYSSILSAYGMSLAEVVQEAQEPCVEKLGESSLTHINDRLAVLQKKVTSLLIQQDISPDSVEFESYLNLRYKGTDTALMVLQRGGEDFRDLFLKEHLREFGFVWQDERPIIVDDIRVRGIGRACDTTNNVHALTNSLAKSLACSKFKSALGNAAMKKDLYFKETGIVSTPVYLLSSLQTDTQLHGPAIIVDKTQTIVVSPSSKARILASHIVLEVAAALNDRTLTGVVDPVQLSVFGHRFMSIAEQMGRALQKTAVSLNIKERLDFACAIFGPTGDLVANAPHVPVFLGSMAYAVKGQIEFLKGTMQPGDVYATNHPEVGGTHLPDITVVTPVFDSISKDIVFFLASRGHHTDIGGLGGTSMPPNSTELWQEGAAILSHKIISNGKFDEEGIAKIFAEPGTRPGCNGSRRLSDNFSDLKAQAAANNKGAILLRRLIDDYSLNVVHFYMNAIQQTAELAVRNFLLKCQKERGNVFRATETMDNSSTIELAITIRNDGSATFDFTGTTPELYSNMNAPTSITYSGIIYCLRSMIGSDIPLNQGCLSPIEIILPKGCFLNPSAHAAVCAGNTQTSQRVVDTILKAFQFCAASQGCMNCLGFFGGGHSTADGQHTGFAYAFGETICGGAGAGPTWHGASGVHTHMTNTRITDAEMLEKRYPVLLREFTIRRGSGGKGLFNGGDGVVRDYECRAPLQFSVISESRTRRPYGLNGGEMGENGRNYWVRRMPDGSERWVNIGQKGMVSMQAGDRCVILTPSGGGWGSPCDGSTVDKSAERITVERNVGISHHPRAVGSLNSWQQAQSDF